MRRKYLKEVIASIILIIIYVMLANARGVSENPFRPELSLEVTVVVPILAGLLISRRTGLVTGLAAPVLNYVLTNDSMQIMMALPYGIVGFIAGYFADKIPSPVIALLVVPTNFLSYALMGMGDAWKPLIYESFIGYIVVVVITNIFRICFKDGIKHK